MSSRILSFFIGCLLWFASCGTQEQCQQDPGKCAADPKCSRARDLDVNADFDINVDASLAGQCVSGVTLTPVEGKENVFRFNSSGRAAERIIDLEGVTLLSIDCASTSACSHCDGLSPDQCRDDALCKVVTGLEIKEEVSGCYDFSSPKLLFCASNRMECPAPTTLLRNQESQKCFVASDRCAFSDPIWAAAPDCLPAVVLRCGG